MKLDKRGKVQRNEVAIIFDVIYPLKSKYDEPKCESQFILDHSWIIDT